MSRNTKNLLFAAALATSLAIVAACGDSPLPTSPSPQIDASGGVASLLSPSKLTDAERAALKKDPNASCPDGHYPEGFNVNLHRGDDTAAFAWQEVPGVSDYQVEIGLYEYTNVWIIAELKAEDRTHFDWPIKAGGRFRARIRTRACDSQYGPWSPYTFFSAGEASEDVATAPIIPVVPPPPGPPSPPGSFYSLGPNIQHFAGLAGAALTCTTSTITGDVGVSPGSAITGIPGLCVLNGSLISTANSVAAQADLVNAFDDFIALPCAVISGNLNGQTLSPGTYCVPAATANLTAPMTLNGAGSYVFILPSTFITGAGAAVNLTGGATCGGVNWAVGSSATLAGSVTGNVIAFSSITLGPGTTLTGRALALNAAVTMTTATITNSGCN